MTDIKIAVFGTLRQGFSQNALMRGNGTTFLYESLLSDYVVMNCGFPASFKFSSLPANLHKECEPFVGMLKVEVYHIVSDEALRRLNQYEGVPDLFDLVVVPGLSNAGVHMYQYQGGLDVDRLIKPNQAGIHDWVAYKGIKVAA